MLEGIDYYPTKRKRTKRKIWLLILMLGALLALYYFYTQNNTPKTTSTSQQIILSEPTVAQEIPLEVSDVKPKLGDNRAPTTPSIESLDKVIQTYQQQQ